MATIRERRAAGGSLHWHVQIRVKGSPPITKTFHRKTDATHWARDTESDLGRGRHVPTHEAATRTVAELVDRYLGWIETEQPHAHDKQRQLLAWWKEQLGDTTLIRMTPALISKKRDELAKEKGRADRRRSPATVNRYLAALSSACSAAVEEWHWLESNPVWRVRKKTEPRGRLRYLSDDERAALLSACAQSPLPELQLIVLLAITTGMRRGEILGIRWADVDMKRNTIVLHKTKNNERRSVPIVPQVHALLKAHGKVRSMASDMVFAIEGRQFAGVLEKAFRQALEVAGIKEFRFHDLRHTAASYLAMSGATTAEIAAVLGHKTLAMVKRYAHLSDQHTASVVNRMTEKYFVR